jgi:DNA adenine methylase
VRPTLRYFGGKAILAPWVAAHFPAHKVYVEPYCGAASVLMAKVPASIEVINDVDDEIVNVFRVLRDRDQAAELERVLRLTPYSETEYFACSEQSADAVERARRTIVRSHMGMSGTAIHRNSGFRRFPRHRVGRYSESVCAREWSTFPDAIAEYLRRLRCVEIRNGDALEVISEWNRPDVLIYADPPYVQSTRTSGAYRFEMTDEQHRALLAALSDAASMVVLSGYRCNLYDERLSDWTRIERAFRDRTECLWLNHAAVRASGMLHQRTIVGFEDIMNEGAA